MQKILVISPHLDDAVLSCHDHIVNWKQKEEVFVLTVFTHFGKNLPYDWLKLRLKESGFLSPHLQEIARKKEDQRAMKNLNVNFRHLNFIDGGYRTYNQHPIYPNSSIFSGRISEKDEAILSELARKLKNFNNFDKIIIPLGVGRHVDHEITRNAAETIFAKNKIAYYIDYPYATKIFNWNLKSLARLFMLKRSIQPMSRRKLESIKKYSSQYPLLFRREPQYSEIILFNE